MITVEIDGVKEVEGMLRGTRNVIGDIVDRGTQTAARNLARMIREQVMILHNNSKGKDSRSSWQSFHSTPVPMSAAGNGLITYHKVATSGGKKDGHWYVSCGSTPEAGNMEWLEYGTKPHFIPFHKLLPTEGGYTHPGSKPKRPIAIAEQKFRSSVLPDLVKGWKDRIRARGSLVMVR